MAYKKYMEKCKAAKKSMKIFLTNGTMLTGLINDYYEYTNIIYECCVFIEHIISCKPA